MDEIVGRILFRLDELGIDQKTFAKEIGVSPVTITDWKTGKSKSYMKKINIISAALASPLRWIMFGEGPSSKMEEAKISGRLDHLERIATGNRDTPLVFLENFLNLCTKIGKSPSAVVTEVGLNKSAVTSWKNGTKPTNSTIVKLSNYFGVSVEELTGKKEPAGQQADGKQEEFIQLYQQLTPQEQAFFLAQLRGYVKDRGTSSAPQE